MPISVALLEIHDDKEYLALFYLIAFLLIVSTASFHLLACGYGMNRKRNGDFLQWIVWIKLKGLLHIFSYTLNLPSVFLPGIGHVFLTALDVLSEHRETKHSLRLYNNTKIHDHIDALRCFQKVWGLWNDHCIFFLKFPNLKGLTNLSEKLSKIKAPSLFCIQALSRLHLKQVLTRFFFSCFWI